MEPTIPALREGQTLYYQPTSHRGFKGEIQEAVIETIARKYIYLKGYHRRPAHKSNLMYVSEYSQASIQYYLTREEIEEKNEHQTLLERIQRYFSYIGSPGSKLSLQRLREINVLLP